MGITVCVTLPKPGHCGGREYHHEPKHWEPREKDCHEGWGRHESHGGWHRKGC